MCTLNYYVHCMFLGVPCHMKSVGLNISALFHTEKGFPFLYTNVICFSYQKDATATLIMCQSRIFGLILIQNRN